MGKGAAISAGFGGDADCAGCFYPFAGGMHKGVAAGLVHKAVEFDRFKIRVVQLLPQTDELNGSPAPQPVFDNIDRNFVTDNRSARLIQLFA